MEKVLSKQENLRPGMSGTLSNREKKKKGSFGGRKKSPLEIKKMSRGLERASMTGGGNIITPSGRGLHWGIAQAKSRAWQ